MNGQPNTTLPQRIHREGRSLNERGLPDHSHFEVQFADGSKRFEHETNWSDISEEVEVQYGDSTKIVMLCKYPLKNIKVRHWTHLVDLNVQPGDKIYQAARSRTTFTLNGNRSVEVIGRIIGVVRDGKVVEERFINGIADQIQGIKF